MDEDVGARLTKARSLASDLPVPGPPTSLVIVVLAGTTMLVVGLVWLLRWLHVPGMIVFALAGLLEWFVIVSVVTGRALKRLRGALHRTAVVVVDKYVFRDASIRMHFLVVENERGQRGEHVVSRRVYASAEVGDVGVLFSKQDQVWGFHRVS